MKSVINERGLCFRYVNDKFILCDSYRHTSNILNLFNKVKPNIRFAIELEYDDKFNFLDVNIQCNSNEQIKISHHLNDI